MPLIKYTGADNKTTKERLNEYLSHAKESGCSREQIEQFLSHGYFPLPWQWEFHATAREADHRNGPVDIGLGGARGPGKSHAILSQVALDDCQRYSDLKVLFIRKTGKSAGESFEDLVVKVMKGKISYQYKNNEVHFDNGSKIMFGGFYAASDIDKYIGVEYDIIIVEELNQLTEEKYTKLRGSLRTSKPNWRPRMYTSFNPGDIGHSFVKERYIKPFRVNKQKETRFIGSTYKDNPHTGESYQEYLEGITGDLGRAWREGDWDLFVGQFFPELRREIHGFNPFSISPHWSKIIALDYGYDHPTAVGWFAIDNDGEVWVYKEYVCRQKTYTEVAEKILELTREDEKIDYLVADPAIWAKKGNQNGMSGAEELQAVLDKRKIVVVPANNDRVNGWGVCREYMKVTNRGGKPHTRLHLSNSLSFGWEKLVELQYDDKRPEDAKKQDGDDWPDMLRYGLMSRVSPAKEKKKEEKPDRYGYSQKSSESRSYQARLPSYKGNLPT